MSSKRADTLAREELYPIRTIATLTGVNPITLRAWERRYGLIRPTRTDSGHRVYTQADIDTVHRILALMDNGVAIGRMRDALATQPPAAAPAARVEGTWADARARMVAAIAQFDDTRIEDIYNEVLALHSIELVTAHLLLPLLAELGERWRHSRGGIAEEHFFAMFLRNKLGARLHHRARSAAGPRLLTACLPGEQHEIGLLLFALAAHEHGFRVVLFGSDMPLEQLSYAARRTHAQAIVLSGSVEPPAELLTRQLPALTREAGIPVFLGGHTSIRHRDAVIAAGVEPLGLDIPAGLRRLATTLTTPELHP